MLKDLQTSEQFMNEYKKMRGGEDTLLEKNQNVEANFHVLSQGSWPISAALKPQIPELISNIQADFEKYYKTRHTGR